jgi:protein-S-isoprenylcysteine O-methyltransferase Ste14
MKPFQQLRALLLPIVVAGIVPAILLFLNRKMPGWQLSLPWTWLAFGLGLLLAGAGLALLAATIRSFARIGGGTLAPWDPPRKLVVRGSYRRVRNPMISGVFAVVLGEALVFLSLPVFVWFLVVVLVNLIYIPLAEEPGLARRFGEEYLEYKKNVPRWIPRLRPWQPGGESLEEKDGQ